MWENFYNQIYFLGLQTVRYAKRFFKWLGALLLRPLKFISALIITAVVVVDKFALKTFHEISDDVKSLFSKARSVSSKAKSTDGGQEKKSVKTFFRYIKKAFIRYRRVFIYTLNILLPIASLAFMLYVIGLWTGTTFALEVNYNGEVIGYVRNESVYKEAHEQAVNRLDIASAGSVVTREDDGELIKSAEYKIKPVKRSQINDAAAICDKLISKSDTKITNACGIYIDNSFICAVKNETDALSVFDSVLSRHETGEENAVVGFVEDINYVQGLYPDDGETVWDASKLNEKLESKKSEARYYTVQTGDTISQIAQKFDITSSELYSLNPSLTENIHVGQSILIEGEVNFVRVQVTKTEKRTVDIPYQSVKVNTDSLYVGDKRTVTKGVNGSQEITELVTYIDGVRVSSKEVSRVTVREAIDEKIQVGTKKNYYGGSSGPVTSYGGRFIWPTIGANSVSSYYGKRSLGGWHGGIDIVRPGGSTGRPVVAADSGTVTLARWNGAYGYCVIIDHGNGLSTLYAHMQSGSICVSAGQRVSRGQQVGRIGGTGNVTGPHLHFEVRVNGTKVNPAPYLGISSKSNYR